MIDPYYVSDDVTIYQGDALSVLQSLPDGCIDAVVTDPPYSSGGWGNSSRMRDPSIKYSSGRGDFAAMLGDTKDQRIWMRWTAAWLDACWRVARDGALLVAFIDWRQLPALTDCMQITDWRWLGLLAWDKINNRPQRGRYRQQAEFIVWGCKGGFVPANAVYAPGVYRYQQPQGRDRYHITEKPVVLLQDLLAIMPDSATVLDPFLGSGTTALAALKTGRKCVGIELSKGSVEIATARIKAVQATE